MKRVFVTGGSGFVGRNLLAHLGRRNVPARALARSDQACAAVQALGAEAVRGDLDDTAALAAGMAGCDLVFHLAALAAEWGAAADFHRINVAGTEAVLAAARTAGVPRLVHVSTEAVLLGGPPIVELDETAPRPPRPLGLYGRTKALAEARVLEASDEALAAVVVRPRFIWGNDDSTLLPALVDAVRTGRFRWIAGGRYPTSTCHVDNVCEGMLLAAERGRGGEIYFLTDGDPVELRAFLTELLATQGVDPGDGSVPRWLARAFAAGGEIVWKALRREQAPPLTRTAVRLIGEEVTVDDGKARRELGYVGARSRTEGLADLARRTQQRGVLPSP